MPSAAGLNPDDGTPTLPRLSRGIFKRKVVFMYNQIYAIIVQYIYENPEALTPYQELVATQLATFMALTCIVLPFLSCLLVCRWFFR